MIDTATVDAAVERVAHEDTETVLAIRDLQRHGMDFYWYEHDGTDTVQLFGATRTGLVYSASLDRWTGEKQEVLNEWIERIRTHFQRLIAASGVQPSPGRAVQYPSLHKEH